MKRAIVLSAAALLCGCLGPDGAPVVMTEQETAGSITLFWQHPDGAAPDGYAIETRRLPQPFAVTQAAPPSQLYAKVTFNQNDELVDYELRVRALPDPQGTRASTPVRHRVGLRAAVLRCLDQGSGQYTEHTCGVLAAPVKLRWAFTSQAADGLLLERQAGGSGPFTPLPAAFPATSYDDNDVVYPGIGYLYRLTLTRGADRSDPVTVYAQ